MTLRTPTPTRPWSLPELGHVLRACAGVRGKHRQLGQAVLQMALLEHACTDDPPRAAGLVERVANGSKKAAAEITALLDAHHQLVQAPPAAPPPPLDARGWAQTYEPAPAPPAPDTPVAESVAAWLQQRGRTSTPASPAPPAPAPPAWAQPQHGDIAQQSPRVADGAGKNRALVSANPPLAAQPSPSPHLPARQSLAPSATASATGSPPACSIRRPWGSQPPRSPAPRPRPTAACLVIGSRLGIQPTGPPGCTPTGRSPWWPPTSARESRHPRQHPPAECAHERQHPRPR